MDTMCESCKDLQIEINNAQKEMNECPCDSPIRGLKDIPDEALLTIENAIPIPEPTTKISILKKMEIGQSVFLKDSKRNSAKHFQKKLRQFGFTITTRKVEGGYRLWRTA